MRVCHYIGSIGLGRGEAYVDLVNALCEQIEIVLLVPKGALFLPRVDERVQVYEYVSKDSRRNPFLFYELYKKIKKINPDLVHTHFAKATEVFHQLNRLLALPHVATKHNPRKGKIFNKIDHVVAVSQGVAESISKNNIKIIHNGITPVTISRNSQESNVFTVLAVGRLEKVKAFDRLIVECSKLDFDYKLLIVGDGPEKTNLVDYVKKYNIKNKVKFLGYRNDIPELMQRSDVIVVCSHTEGFSLVILEGLYYGNVVISRNVGIASSLLSDKFLIKDYEISSKLEEVYRCHDNFKDEFIEVRKLNYTKYLIKNSINEYIEYYRQILL
jgi:glycosyltransferase involved in cell wall biosynthesis